MLNRVWPYLLFLLILGIIVFVINKLPGLIPIPDNVIKLAEEGVVDNQAWKPIVRQIKGVDMVLVPAGCFTMGSTDEQLQEANSSCNRFFGAKGCQVSFEDEQPAHQVCLSEPFWLDRTPVTNLQYGSNSSKGYGNSQYRGSSWPRETVTWQEAADFCLQRGARLPTEAEWEFAARGPDALIYPFGNEYDIHKVTLNKISPAPVGQVPEGASWVSALDMSGGISEWVADWYGPYSAEEQNDPAGPESGIKRITRGGNWFAHAAFYVRSTSREALDPGYATSVIGFRCARNFIQ
jgi:formylglycine-generating enzyme required for sulfatase activity